MKARDERLLTEYRAANKRRERASKAGHVGDVGGHEAAPADYCQDPRHETPCLLPCPACAIECQPSQNVRP